MRAGRPEDRGGEDLWLLVAAEDADGAAARYGNARLLAAAAQAGLSARLLDPVRIAAEPPLARPKAALLRTSRGPCAPIRAVMAELEAAGALCLPGAASLAAPECPAGAAAVVAAAGLPVAAGPADEAGAGLRVLVIGGAPRAATVERRMPGCAAVARAVPLTAAAAGLAAAAARALGFEIAGVDLRAGPGGLAVAHVSAAPGFAALDRATGRDIAQEIVAHLGRRLVAPCAAEA